MATTVIIFADAVDSPGLNRCYDVLTRQSQAAFLGHDATSGKRLLQVDSITTPVSAATPGERDEPDRDGDGDFEIH
jgi:hypothetical protein